MDRADSTTISCAACGRRNRVPVAANGTPHCAHCAQRLPWLVEAGDDNYAQVAEASRLPVLVDLWAPWCGPCRAVTPVVEQTAREFAGQLKVVKVNIDTAPGLSKRLGVQSIPTLLLLRDGREVSRHVGAPPGTQLLGWVRRALATPSAR